MRKNGNQEGVEVAKGVYRLPRELAPARPPKRKDTPVFTAHVARRDAFDKHLAQREKIAAEKYEREKLIRLDTPDRPAIMEGK